MLPTDAILLMSQEISSQEAGRIEPRAPPTRHNQYDYLARRDAKDGTHVPVALTIEMTFAISNEVTSANPSRLRLVLAPYNALRKAVNIVLR